MKERQNETKHFQFKPSFVPYSCAKFNTDMLIVLSKFLQWVGKSQLNVHKINRFTKASNSQIHDI